MCWSKSELNNLICLTEVLLFNRKRFNKCLKLCGKRYIHINILENAILNIDTLKHKCSINEFIISLE